MADTGSLVEMDNSAAKDMEINTSSRTDTTNQDSSKAAAPAPYFDSLTRDEKYQLGGWAMFVLCAIVYIIAAIEAESLTSLIGGILFLLACAIFMIPLIWKEKHS